MADTTITGTISTGQTLHGTLGASPDVPTGAVVTGNEISGQMVGGPKGETGPKGDPGTTDYNDLDNLPDLTLKADKADTYTKSEVDTKDTTVANTAQSNLTAHTSHIS